MSNKTEKVVQLAKEKTKEKEEHVLKIIKEIKETGEKITFYSVYNKANVSKSFVYGNETIRKKIEEERNQKTNQKTESKDQIIEVLKKKISLQEKEIHKLKNDNYKEKYAESLQLIKELESKIEKMYGEVY